MKQGEEPHPWKVVENVALRLVGENNIGGNSKGHARHEGDERRYVRHFCEAIKSRRAQTPIDQQGVMMTDYSTQSQYEPSQQLRTSVPKAKLITPTAWTSPSPSMVNLPS